LTAQRPERITGLNERRVDAIPGDEYDSSVRQVSATRYVTPLREGGSLPAIVEGDDLGTYVLKFRGAGQGVGVLIAELVCGEIARALGLPQPETVLVYLDPALARSEPDPEIQALIKASAGLNLALDYLPGSFAFDPAVGPFPDADLASSIVWFDAFITNVDRTPRNTNLLIWHKKLWLIDNGAALYFQYNWEGYMERSRTPFPQVKDHVLLPWASRIPQADANAFDLLTPSLLAEIVALVPEEWLGDTPYFESESAHRAAYVAYFAHRLQAPRSFVQEAISAHAQLV
jgi:hypothetical protein